MKNIKKRLIGWTLGLALSLGVGIGIASNTHSEIARVEAASGDSYTFSSDAGTSIDGNWSFTTAKNKGTTSPAFNENSKELRLYPKNSITFTAKNGVTLKSASFTNIVNKNKKGVVPTGWSINAGEITTYADTLTTFDVTNINGSTFTITINGSAGNVGLKTVSVIYESDTPAPDLTGITLAGQKTDYFVGEKFAFNGTCTATFADGSSYAVTPTSVSEPDMSTAGEKTIEVSYTTGGVTKTTSYTINVTEFVYTGDGTKENPFTVADAIHKATAVGGTATAETYFVKGKIAKIDTAFSSKYGNMTFSVSDDGSTENVFQFFRCVADENVKFDANSSKTIVVGEEILGCGKILSHNGTPEFDAGCYPYDYKATSISTTEPIASGLKIGDAISSVSQLGITITADIEVTGEKRDVTAEATVEPATLVEGENTVTIKYTQTNKYSGVTTNNAELTTAVIVNVVTTQATDMAIVAGSTTIYVGETTTLKATLSGGTNNYQRTIGWTSSDTAVIANPENSVDGAEFNITALKEGTTTITGTVVAPGSATASVTITVKPARTETDITLHGKMLKTEYNVGDKWDLTGLDLEVSWSDGTTTFVELNDEKVLTNCKPETVTNISLTSFALEIVYVGKVEFTKEFTIDGFTVTEILKEIYDFVSGFGTYASKWESSYSKHQLTHSDLGSAIEADVELIGSKQTTNITDKPVFKGAANEVVIDFALQKAGYIIKHVDIEFAQWTTKAPTMSLYKGVYSAGSSKINSLTIGKDNLVLSGDVNDSRFQVCTSGGDQVGLSSIMITYVKDSGLLNEALAFGTSFLNKTADACADGTKDNSEALKAAWTRLKTEFSALSDGAKKVVKDVAANNAGTDLEKAMARYDHIVKRYSDAHTEINDFIGRGVTTSLTNQLFKANTTNNIMVISLIACASAAAIGSFFFIRKRKEQN